MTEPSPNARRLVALAEEELDLLAAGRVDALAELQERRDAALAALPAELSAADRGVLARAHQLQVQVAALLERALSETAAELGRLDRGHAALRGYAGSLKRA
ncbi:MAG TPA: hypothetical protein VGJ32_09630 [Solirubrobacteraceae bacterium]